jgi:E-phenylitaconyl-CoA hydratase
MTGGPPIQLAVDGAIAEVAIDRPHALNALDPASLAALRDALAACRDDARVRVVVLTGRGERAFCVGTDLKATAGAPAGYIRGYRLDTLGLDKPLIAAVNGHCLGGGLELALQCDLRIAASHATFGLPEARVGSFPGGGGAPLLLRALPRAVAMRMLLTGEAIGAAQAREHGLVSDVVDAAVLRDAARDLARRVAACAPLSLAAIRRVAAASEGRGLDEVYRLTWEAFDALASTADRDEGRRAFAEKRPPRFEGR